MVTYVIKSYSFGKSLGIGSHLGNVGGPPKVSFLYPPCYFIQFCRWSGCFAGHFNAEFGVAIDRGIIYGNTTIARNDFAVSGQDERVDFRGPAIIVLESLVETHDSLPDGREKPGWYLHSDGKVQRIIETETTENVDVHLRNLLLGYRLDVHPAFSTEHDDRTAGLHRRIDNHTHIEFPVNVQLFFYQDLFYFQIL